MSHGITSAIAKGRPIAGFSRHNRKGDRPPWNLATGKEVVAQTALLFSKTKSEERYATEVEGNDRKIEFVQAHAGVEIVNHEDREEIGSHVPKP